MNSFLTNSKPTLLYLFGRQIWRAKCANLWLTNNNEFVNLQPSQFCNLKNRWFAEKKFKHIYLQDCWIVWWQLQNFSVVQLKVNRFLHLNEPPKRIFWLLKGLLIKDCQILDSFSFQSRFCRPKFYLIFLKMIFLSE